MRIPIHCHSALDLRGETWPTSLAFRPMVGDLIKSQTERSDGFRLQLVVTKVTIVTPSDKDDQKHIRGERGIRSADYLLVELHVPHPFKSVQEFQEWYATVL